MGAVVTTPLAIAPDHPAFAGHFPGRPILPGVVLLSEALAAIEASSGRGPEAWTVSTAKFLEPVAPGAALTLSHETLASGAIRFEIRGAAGVVVHGTLSPRA
jgi:3-hydroxymyristoyl/3-hydroxydecanoyl-(acyl carrier protein) dehydratase